MQQQLQTPAARRVEKQKEEEEEEEGSYMAALKSAAADREREQHQLQQRGVGMAARTPSPGRRAGAAAPPSAREAAGGCGAAGAAEVDSAAAAAAAEERLRARLRAVYESGLVVQLPFLSAAHAAPLALFNAPHTPHVTPHGLRGGVGGVDAEAHRAVAQVVWEAQQQMQLGGADAAAAATSGGGGGAGVDQQQRWQQERLGGGYGGGYGGQQEEVEEKLLGQLPAGVWAKLLKNPSLQNLGRCIGYHKSTLDAVPLERGSALEVVKVVDDMSMALKMVLSAAMDGSLGRGG